MTYSSSWQNASIHVEHQVSFAGNTPYVLETTTRKFISLLIHVPISFPPNLSNCFIFDLLKFIEIPSSSCHCLVTLSKELGILIFRVIRSLCVLLGNFYPSHVLINILLLLFHFEVVCFNRTFLCDWLNSYGCDCGFSITWIFLSLQINAPWPHIS